MVEQVLGNFFTKVQIPVREVFSLVEKNNCPWMNPRQDLNYHAETHLSDIL